jgi:uncharacterized protein
MTQPNISREIRRCAMWCHAIVLVGQLLLIPAFFLVLKISDSIQGSMKLGHDIIMSWGLNMLLLLPLVDLCWSIGLVCLFWQFNRHRHQFIEVSGKEMINFLLSLILYLVVIDSIAISSCGFSVYNNMGNLIILSGVLFAIVGIINLFLLILVISMAIAGSSRTAKGEIPHYPMTIRFIN